jgi:class 3 adenylate cyclase
MNHYYAAVRRELKTLRGKEVVTTGDGLLATFGAPAAGVRCATAIREAVRTLGLEIRVGLHAGEYKVSGAEVFGLAFHIGARVAAKARAGRSGLRHCFGVTCAQPRRSTPPCGSLRCSGLKLPPALLAHPDKAISPLRPLLMT